MIVLENVLELKRDAFCNGVILTTNNPIKTESYSNSAMLPLLLKVTPFIALEAVGGVTHPQKPHEVVLQYINA
jgi:hypothetical protein